jgi:hypothetical protein
VAKAERAEAKPKKGRNLIRSLSFRKGVTIEVIVTEN